LEIDKVSIVIVGRGGGWVLIDFSGALQKKQRNFKTAKLLWSLMSDHFYTSYFADW